MKNSFIFKITFLFVFLTYSLSAFSEELKFEATSIEIIDKDKNESFLEIFQSEEGQVSKVDQKVFITTDSWLAQLGSRKNS